LDLVIEPGRPGPKQALSAAGNGISEHPPQGIVPQRHVVAGEQPLEVITGKCR
jgi:hypothetical protein